MEHVVYMRCIRNVHSVLSGKPHGEMSFNKSVVDRRIIFKFV